jgi:hypothetical protein
MAQSDYSDLDDEIRPRLNEYVRDVIATGRAYYPEAFKLFWPQTLHYWRHREAFYGAIIRLGLPETTERWGLKPEEVAEYRRIRADDEFVKFDNPLDDIEIRCGPGWNGILRQMLNEINAADVKVHGLVADEDQGRLRLDYASAEPWLPAAKILVLTEFRSYYTCETCGRPGEHRANEVGWKHTRCAEHRPPPPNDGAAIYTQTRTPWRRMSDGDWAYDPAGDKLERMPGRLIKRYPQFFELGAVIDLFPEQEPIIDDMLREIRALEIARDYRIRAVFVNERSLLEIIDSLYSLPDCPERDVMMTLLAYSDDRIAKLPHPERQRMSDILDVLKRWQRGQLSGAEARQLTGVWSYGDLYKLAKRYDVDVRVLPRDLVSRIADGTMTDAEAAEFLGSSLEDWLALKVALTAVGNPES